ncbi:MAG TPA: protocatechuate 3,4-dioxygenase subunit beta, partial [Xanthobacteraceae bacterium]|nr:protocatechuate 3,4-dioxygenase subunit beta [Xanthobacteraceae bacterium]
IGVAVFARGMLRQCYTLLYFSDEKARARMVSRFDLAATVPDWALAYEFDIVLRGRNQTPAQP